ncbi:MAG: penicillin-binding protein 2 [Acholeplasmataceae bacterium]|nr:penicillin-binding protein 2 [Acholeplasmataceae bacterium]
MLNKKYAYRLELLMIASMVIFAVLIGRMAYLQLYKGDYYYRLSEGNRIRAVKILAPRGIIYDCNGEELVKNEPGFVVSLLRTNEKPDMAVINKLATIIEVPPEQILEKIKQNEDSYEPIRIKSNLSAAMVTKIEERSEDLPGILLEMQSIRKYVNNELAVHVLGYVGEVSEYEISKGQNTDLKAGSIVGKSGLERYYDNYLRGTDGSYREEVDVAGRVVQTLDELPPKPGQGLVLTVDAKLQREAEKIVDEHLKYLRSSGFAPKANAAAIVAIDPRNGAIKALVSRPGFNPNLFVNGISSKDWQTINDNPFDPMSNKVISGEYPPGSTFKIVTGSAALETGKVTPQEMIFDSGKHWLIPMGNAEGEALGWLNFHKALAASDNVYFYEIGNRVGIDVLKKYAAMFGFGKTTGIDLFGENEGIIASPEYKMKVFDEDWYLGDTFNAAIGQGFNLATPIQLAVMLSAVANNGDIYKPHLVDKIVNDDGSVVKEIKPEKVGRLPVSAETLELLQSALKAVAQEGGTAAQMANLSVPVAGKTGTAENPHGKDHGLFVGYAPADNPNLVVVAVIDQGGFGSVSAAPIVQRIFEYVFPPKQPAIVNTQKKQ